MHELVYIAYSPWSARARLALDAQGVSWKGSSYVPTLSEPLLRWRLGRFTGKLTTPILFPDDGPPLTDSFDIAVWASARSATPLIREDTLAACTHFNALADRALEAGRVRTTRRVRDDAVALRESSPPFLAWLGPVGSAIARKASNDLLAKYSGPEHTDQVCQDQMFVALGEIEQALGKREWLLDAFSYADITAAVALSFVSPHASAPLGPTSRTLWTEPALAERFAGLITWRDRVLAEARSRRPPRP